MRSPTHVLSMAATLLSLLAIIAAAQQATPKFTPIASVPFDTTSPVLRAAAESQKPFTVAGTHGVLLGQQDGTLEAWVLPVKLLSHLTLEAEMKDYPVPIDVNRLATQIEVRPDRTVLTYSHIGFTVRQIMFSPGSEAWRGGPVVLYEFDCLRPTDFTFRFTPELKWMWPERNEGVPNVEWVPAANQGYYILHSDYPDLAGAITIPGAQPGILAPYQERPQAHPVELRLHIDPAHDNGRLFPLLMTAGMNPQAASNSALGATLAQFNADIPAAYAAHAESWKKLLASATSIDTPNAILNEAFQWATISIEQLKATITDKYSGDETALVAGYYASGDSARPGFGWFFGRDALYTLYAVNGFGDFKLTRDELLFLIHRQRADGKIMHEYSQTAPAIDWQSFPYMYAAADATPLFLLAMADYARSSGDIAFLREHREAIEKAWQFEITHDTDGDGIYDNSQGTGWVESWPGGMPHQEIYLALLDQQASTAMAMIETQLQNPSLAASAQQRATAITKTINAEYYDAQKGCYAFSRNADGTLDRTTTIYPALAWWDPGNGKGILTHPDKCLAQFSSSALNTDWGTRDVSNQEPIYDGMSYHQGSVWPLFTGWAAVAEYRGSEPLAGYQLLMENANLTRAQDIGAVTELLSGDFFVPFGRSTSHQLWSSAMVITPVLRGLFGISIDAQTKTVTVSPHLPASWDHAEVQRLQLPGATASLSFTQKDGTLDISLIGANGWHLRGDLPGASYGPLKSSGVPGPSKHNALDGIRISLPALEADYVPNEMNLIESVRANLPTLPAQPGARTSRFRVLHSEYADRKLILTVQGLAGNTGILRLVRHGRILPEIQPEAGAAWSAELSFRSCDADPYACSWLPLILNFPPGDGWKTITVTLTW
jgi:glycogen debranching enzyme